MRFEGRFDVFALFMLLGISQGIFLSYYFLNKRNRSKQVNLFVGLFLLTSVILASEILLNYTGIIVKVIRIENYSEPFIFLLAPLYYMIIKSHLDESSTPMDHIHYVPFVFYFLYTILYFLQSPEYKFNSYVYCYQPDWDYLPVNTVIPEDPFGLRRTLAPLYLFQAFIYMDMVYVKLKHNPLGIKFTLFKKKDPRIRPLFRYWIHALVLTLFISFVKITFDRDLGDYLVGTYISIILYVSAFIVITRRQDTIHRTGEEVTVRPKYEKSSLTEEKKDEILQKIVFLLEEKKYFIRNTLSLSDIAKAVNEASHHVSQVINEKTGKNFFDLLSVYRIGEAQLLLQDKSNKLLTIEEIAERVGYNSKAAFNKTFKAITGQTPSEYRRSK